jgi:hypothetical protein
MPIDRRRFMQLGAMAALMDAAGCCPSPLHMTKIPAPPAPTPPAPPPNTLWVNISGLYLLEELDAAMLVHLVDAEAIGMTPHRAMLQVKKSMLDDLKTGKPDHVLGTSDETWVWDLKGRWVTMPVSGSGGDDLKPIGTSTEDDAEIPMTEAGWNSKARIPDLRTICGATKITNERAVASTMGLTHGQVNVLQPDGVGSRAVWQFPNNGVLIKRALSNKIRYWCPTGGQQLTIWVGVVPIVFKNGGGLAEVSNLPDPQHVKEYSDPTMKHFRAFYKMVDKRTTPDICLFRWTPLEKEDAGTDYCPGGGI